jgi:hypothetical protein
MNKLVFFTSIVAALVLWAIENLVGIHWDFHPDAITYTSDSFEMVGNLLDSGFFASFNNFYYFVATILQQNVILLVTLNVIVYALTNISIFIYVKKIAEFNNVKFNLKLMLFLACILFMPYRLHLAVHVLKDTLIIFFLIQLLSKSKVNLLVNGFFIAGLRLFSLLYLSVLIKKKYFYMGAFLVGIVVIFTNQQIIELIESRNDVDMTFREFDIVPNFVTYGLFGSLVRAILWPIFAFTGTYLLLSPSIAFVPIAIGSMAMCIVSYWAYKIPAINFQSLIIFGIIAMLTSGFTTYIRYCFPLLILAPILQFKAYAETQNSMYR